MPIYKYINITLIFITITAVVLYIMGRVPICECGYIKFFEFSVKSEGNSQHIFDWYTFSHIIHGFLFYWLFRVFTKNNFYAFIGALTLESFWEILENTPMIINRYREQALAQGYNGDSILNAVFDILAMVIGFYLVKKLKLKYSIILILFMEIMCLFIIRDNLTLNVINLIYPLEVISNWQSGT